MLRRVRRETGVAEGGGTAEETAAESRPARRRWRRIAAGIAAAALVLAATGLTQKDHYTDDLAELSRRTIGDENTARLEGVYFRLQDRIDRAKYRVLGGEGAAFNEHVTVQYVAREPRPVIVIDRKAKPAPERPELIDFPPPPKLLEFPKVQKLREKPDPGEGEWTTAGLPGTTPERPLMAKTFVRPDPGRPYAVVGVLLVDASRVRLKMVGGTKDPGGDRGVAGPGAIPETDLTDVLVAWNGGFQGPHGGYGMTANGKEYRPLRNGLATIAVMDDGSLKMGEWGRTLTREPGMAGIRQNAALLVENCEVSSRTSEGNDTWGYVEVNSADFITWRSAIGLTKEGNLLVAAGNSLSAATLAKALWAAGACTAMQLDINTPYVLTSLFFKEQDGSLRAERFMPSMPDSPGRFLRTQERDFMYLTYRP
ncbi:MAG: phosphodiester glycosidase family protein [Dehalococcoidia bacterium]